MKKIKTTESYGNTLYSIITTNHYRKQVRLVHKQGKNLSKLMEIVALLANGKPLPPKYRDHKLVGNFGGARECHIEPDWLLIYRIDNNNLILELLETGSHSELF